MTLLYVDGCPNWRIAEARVREAIERLGRGDADINSHRVGSGAQAEALGFRGSPTILVAGRDLFAESDAPVELSCRLYASRDGLEGAPTVDQLLEALR